MFAQIEPDKQLHALGGGFLAFPSYGVAKHELKMSKFESALFSVGVSTLFGIGKELYDKNKTGFDWEDVAYTTAGSVISVSLILVLDGKHDRDIQTEVLN